MGHNMYAQTRGLVTCGTFVRGYISPIFGMSTHLTFQLTDCVQTLIEFFLHRPFARNRRVCQNIFTFPKADKYESNAD